VSTPHEVVNPAGMAPAVGFAHAVAAAAGRLVLLGGQTAQAPDGSIVGSTVVEQWDVAAANLVTALRAVGGRPEHLTALTIYTTRMAEYRASLSELAGVYRRHLGRHYPAMALIGVAELFDPAAVVELVATAVIAPA
jgi:enamine deaminase RidA (YjgF/YER057c/UK114 family)